MQPVRELDEHDPDVTGHRHQHLAEVLGLRLGPAPEREVGELAYPVDELGDRLAELGRDLRLGGRGVLDDVVEQRGDDGFVIEAHLREDLRDLHGMLDVGFARRPVLAVVGVGAEQEGAMDRFDLCRIEVCAGKAAEVADAEHARAFSRPASAPPAMRDASVLRGCVRSWPPAPGAVSGRRAGSRRSAGTVAASSGAAEGRRLFLRLVLGEDALRRLFQDALVHHAFRDLAKRDDRRFVPLMGDEQR